MLSDAISPVKNQLLELFFMLRLSRLQHNLSGLPGLNLIKATSIVHLQDSMAETDCVKKHHCKKPQAHPV